jgi:Spy/CpxP family protein refolding chaperone
MREFKTTILAAVVLAFIAGLGAGAWIGDLRASPAAGQPSVDRRLKNWTDRFDLTPSQQRRLRSVLIRYDSGRDQIFSELNRDQRVRLEELRRRSQEEIDDILKERTAADSPAGG